MTARLARWHGSLLFFCGGPNPLGETVVVVYLWGARTHPQAVVVDFSRGVGTSDAQEPLLLISFCTGGFVGVPPLMLPMGARVGSKMPEAP